MTRLINPRLALPVLSLAVLVAGGLAMVVAAVDSRVGPVVSQIPNVSGRANAPLLFGPERIETLRAMLVDDRGERLDGREAATVPVVSDDPTVTCALPSAVAFEAIGALSPRPSTYRRSARTPRATR